MFRDLCSYRALWCACRDREVWETWFPDWKPTDELISIWAANTSVMPWLICTLMSDLQPICATHLNHNSIGYSALLCRLIRQNICRATKSVFLNLPTFLVQFSEIGCAFFSFRRLTYKNMRSQTWNLQNFLRNLTRLESPSIWKIRNFEPHSKNTKKLSCWF